MSKRADRKNRKREKIRDGIRNSVIIAVIGFVFLALGIAGLVGNGAKYAAYRDSTERKTVEAEITYAEKKTREDETGKAYGVYDVKLNYTAGDGAKLEILLDDLNAEPVAVIDLPAAAEARSELFSLPQTIMGQHDLYFRFSQADMALLQWQFFSPLEGK